MPKSPQEHRPNDPFRDLDWRWQAAQQPPPPPQRRRRKTAGTSAPAIGDEWLSPARDYLSGGRTAPHSSSIEGAIALRTKWKGLRRRKVESLILTRLPFADVARRCRVSSQTVEAYHALFFDVRDRLDDQQWINTCVLGRDSHGNCRSHGDGEILKRVAYDQGAPAFDAYLAVMTDRKLPKGFAAPYGPDDEHKDVYRRLSIKLALARQRAVTDEQRAALVPIEEELKKLRTMNYGDESPAERAARVFDEVFIHNSKLFKAAMRKAARQKANS